MMRAGSVCSGYGGLEMGLSMVLDFELTWVADVDPGASKILAHRYPTVPNLGDITAVDWAAVEPVDIMLGGFPCQDISYAGRGEGIKEGTRSGLWKTIAHAARVLRPRLLVLENVAGIVVRRPGLDVVVANLAEIGFDAEWTTLRASDVGAPHQRDRWFCLAYPQGDGRQWSGPARGWGTGPADHGDAAAYPQGDGRHQGRAEPAGLLGGLDASLSGAASSADPEGQRHRDAGPTGERGLPAAAVTGDPPGDVDWGPYRPAVTSWGRILGRPAPRPTEPGRTGERLSPRFVEWLMGLPAGHVTDVPGLSRNQMLHALGNGVVPLQAAYAAGVLLDRAGEGVAA
ncbi:DNA cytosine methyltransferase [Sphaerisporangium sp. NPDC049002]|uniref:DNA cytosine methyltransferase n=1 Tax=Sphaerisporangium sp. NPDC049002 TaxID=3155392 RepID=UPI0033EA0D31